MTSLGAERRERHELSEVCRELSEAMASGLAPAALHQAIVDLARQALDVRGASLILVDPASGQLSREAIAGTPVGSVKGGEVFNLGDGVAGWVAVRRVAAVTDGADPRFAPQLDAGGPLAGALAAVPLMVDGVVGGILEVFEPLGRTEFSGEDQQALAGLAAHASAALKLARTSAACAESQRQVRSSSEALEQRISERTNQLAAAKREWERAFDAVSEPLFWLDDFTIRRANLAVSSLCGLDIRCVVGKSCYELLANRSEPCAECPARGNGQTAEVKLRGRTFQVSSFSIEGHSHFMVYRDVTHARRLEERLLENQKMASVGRLAAGAAHEINNPLGFLRCNLDLLGGVVEEARELTTRLESLRQRVTKGDRAGVLAELGGSELISEQLLADLEEAPQLVSEARTGADRVREIVRALKELSQDSAASRTPEDPWHILERALKRANIPEDRVVKTGLRPLKVQAEPLPLELAFANVLRNALQASDPETPIRISVSQESEWALVTISDQGCGMAPEVRSKAFDPFFTTRGIGGGLGLGLTAAYGTISRHGGTIEVQSEPGCGTDVHIRLPLAA